MDIISQNSQGPSGSTLAIHSTSSSTDNLPNTSRPVANNTTRNMHQEGSSNTHIKAERDEVDSIGYQPSASEDDDARQSDSQSSSRRQSRLGKMTPPLASTESNVSSPSSAQHPIPALTSAITNANQQGSNAIQNKHRNLRALQSALSPTGSLSGTSGNIPALSSHSHSGGEASASASSSRSHLPLQSKTSLYRRQASGASSISNEPVDDIMPAGHFTGRGSESLSRAKSVSSVSSVNSTSSMEAVPFRAAPLGNVRVGFGGLARGAARANMANASTGNRSRQPNVPNTAPANLDAHSDFGPASNDLVESSTDQDMGQNRADGILSVNTASNHAETSSPISPTKARYLPKGPSDEWQYRNAPGMGGGRNSRLLPHTVSAGSRPPQPRMGIPSAFAGLLANDDVESDESSLHQVQRPKPSIRTKLAKRAGKLGLKPLTSVQAPSARSISPPPSLTIDQATSMLRKDHQTSPAVSLPMINTAPAPLTPTSNTSAEIAARNSKSYFGSMSNAPGISSIIGSGSVGSSGNLAFLESDITRATSSITNAPLVVPKHPPGPPGSGPPPSPGLVGSAANYVVPFAQIPSRLSPQEEQPIVAGTSGMGEIERMREAGMKTPDSARPRLSRPGSVSSGISGVLGGILGTSNIGGGNSNRSSYGPQVNAAPSRSLSASPAPIMLTPAQKIQMEARAGLAIVPSEPSGASPGPDGDQDVLSDLSIATIGRRPMSTSVSTQTTAKPKEMFTATQNPIALSGASVPAGGSKESSSPRLTNRRPNLLRALTGESIGIRSLGSIKNDDSRLTDNKIRSGHSSPRSPSSGSDRYVLSIEKSPSSLRLEIPGNPIPEETNDTLQAKTPVAINTTQNDTQVSNAAAAVLSQATNGNDAKSGDTASRADDESAHAASINSETRPSALPSIAISNTSTNASVDAKPSPISTQPTPGAGIMTSSQLDTSPETPIAPSKSPGITNASRIARTREDFFFGDLIGEGSYSTVMEAWDLLPLREKGLNTPNQDSGDSNNALAAIAGKTSRKNRAKVNLDGAKVYAIKVLDKVHILKEKKQKYVSVEKEALSLLTRQPGVITLFWTFQDRDSLYFVLEMAPNGELLNWIKKLGSFNEQCAKYYAAQLLDTIQSIHKAGVLHRDVKPENVLLDAEMRIRLADFGSAKIVGRSNSVDEQKPSAKFKQRSSSFVGTAEYVSPELLTDKQVSEASDYWAIGCILFQMLCGRPPFKGASEYQTFQKIMKGNFDFQSGFSEVAIDLITKLLELNPDDRPLGNEIRAHAFFEGIDWSTIWTIDAPELEAGLYKRPPVAPRSNPQSIEGDASLDGSMDSQDDGIATASEVEETSRSGHGSLQSGEAQDTQTTERDVTGDNDADDDDSSLSDSPVQTQLFRKRGFSAGASAAERMLAQVSNTTRRGSNLINKVTAGLASFDRNDSSSTLSKGQRSSVIGSVKPTHPSRSSSQMSNRDYDAYNAIVNQQAADASKFNASLATSWAALLLPNESLLYACPIVHKTSGPILRSTNKKRQLLLTDFPRLLCVKETNDQLKVKSEVILGIPLSVTSKGKGNADQQNHGSGRPQHARLNSTGSNSSLGANVNASIAARPGDRVSVVRSSQMRRQSSAGPLLPSSPTSSTGPSSGFRQANSTSMARDNSTGGSSNHPFNVAISQSSPLTPTHSRSSGPLDEKYITPSISLVDVSQASPNMMTSIEAKSIRSFIVHTPARSYLYEDPSGDASHWVKSISMASKRQTSVFNPTTNSSHHAVPLTSHYTMPT